MDYGPLLNPRAAAVPPSGIRKFFDLVSEMPEAISLGVGEPDFVTPWGIRTAAIDSLTDGLTQYTSNWGRVELRRLIAQYMGARFGVNYSPTDEILVTIGASEGIDLALRALVQPGAEVLIPEPAYVSYAPGVVFAGGTPVAIPTRAEDEFRLTPAALRAALSPHVKALILPYPNNPTGAMLRPQDAQALADVLRGTDVLVIADEIYAELTYGGYTHTCFASLPDMWQRTVTLNGFSKAFAMTGWRVGYACGPREILALMCKIHQYTIMCASTQGQIAAEAALRAGLEDGFADVRAMVASYDRRRRLMVTAFRGMGLDCFEPLGAFYVFPSIGRTGLTAQAFCEGLLRAEQVACVPGDAFGASGQGHIRCCYATALDKLQEALRRIRRYVEGLEGTR
ncbi:MAG: aminotransferase class I/II-fold pyridoxal phosphate-dependent enzyme [Oscillospiraceae bacterium]|nr:aminotransferase class I/II-fold pyridoxal phosphate-dependent enzyme [Oscillospiraceae bacterium]